MYYAMLNILNFTLLWQKDECCYTCQLGGSQNKIIYALYQTIQFKHACGITTDIVTFFLILTYR